MESVNSRRLEAAADREGMGNERIVASSLWSLISAKNVQAGSMLPKELSPL